MDFMGRHILAVSIESAAPARLRDFEVWRCELCKRSFAQSGRGDLFEVEFDAQSGYGEV